MVSKFGMVSQQREVLLFPIAVIFWFQILWETYVIKPTIFPKVYKLTKASQFPFITLLHFLDVNA